MMRDRLSGKSALITGGASGVGRATAIRFAQEGASTICLYDRDAANLEVVAQEIRELGAIPITMVGDVTATSRLAEAVDAVVTSAGRLDILVSNAAIDGAASFLEMTEEEWHRVLNSWQVGSSMIPLLASWLPERWWLTAVVAASSTRLRFLAWAHRKVMSTTECPRPV